jgi:hypothetical protein
LRDLAFLHSAGLWGWRGRAPHQGAEQFGAPGAEQFGAPSASAFYVFFMCIVAKIRAALTLGCSETRVFSYWGDHFRKGGLTVPFSEAYRCKY